MPTARSAGQILVCPGHEQAIRWADGERFEQIFENRCDRMRERARIIGEPQGIGMAQAFLSIIIE